MKNHPDIKTCFDIDLAKRSQFICGLTKASLAVKLSEAWDIEDWAVCSAICVEMQFRKSGHSDEPKKDDPECLKP